MGSADALQWGQRTTGAGEVPQHIRHEVLSEVLAMKRIWIRH
jgi:hypothetical protein